MTQALVPYQREIEASKKMFLDISKKTDTAMVFEVESQFALQSIQRNDYIASIANKNLDSLRNAIINVASVGLSLNPVTAYAYLVPRENQICLDVSYKGLIKLATDSGSILWARADLVYENDDFKYLGPASIPKHEADVFAKDRGPFVGCYCICKTKEGDILVEVMSAAEINLVKDSSKAKQAGTPWVKWFGEMAKKTVIKRASKTWPRSDKNERLAKAISVINEHEGIDYDIDITGVELITEDQIIAMKDLLKEKGANLDKFLEYAMVEKLEQIEQKNYNTLIADIKAKGEKK
jgi:recombination protein RecT